jgi:hypothetical protein
MATTAANESWNPASSSVYGFQASRIRPPTSRKCQRSRCRAASHAIDPSAPAIPARQADDPGETEDASRDEDHVLAAHRQEVVEAGGPKRVSELGRQALVLTEHDALEDGVSLARQPRCK